MQVDEDEEQPSHVDSGLMQLDDNDEEEEEDEIVREMDVYISPAVAHQLYLLQYPLQQFPQRRQGQQSHHRPAPLAARIKPKHNMLEIDHGIPTAYMESEGSIHLPQRTFASHTVPVTTHLALGKVVKETDRSTTSDDTTTTTSKCSHALHLAPLSHITQMRPTFIHIDMNDMDNIRALEEQQEKAAAAQAKLDRKPLMFQKKESERAALARKNSFAYKKASEEGEHWIELSILDLDDLDSAIEEELPSEDEIQQLQKQLECPMEARSQPVVEGDQTTTSTTSTTATAGENNNNNNKQTPSLVSYVRSLDYLPASTNKDEEDEFTHPNIVDWIQGGLDETAFVLPTLGAHLTALLRGGWPIPYSILRRTLPPKVKEEDILTALASCAVMIRGNFCLQSRLIPKLPKSVAKARTFIMLLLQCTGIVHRSRLDYVYGIGNNNNNNNSNNHDNFATEDVTTEIIHMLLEQLGKKTPQGWILRGQDDVNFLAKHPHNTELHMQYWGRQMIRFQDYLQCYASAVVE